MFSWDVLSNRSVFKLVDLPLADMAALLHAFLSTPPVVRRHAKELLDFIRDAVRNRVSAPAAPERTHSGRGYAGIKRGGEHPAPAPATSYLCSHSKVLPTPSTISALFGPATVLLRSLAVHSTCQSSPFGAPPPSTEPKPKFSGRFQDAVKKIHGTLIVAPSVPQVRVSHILIA